MSQSKLGSLYEALFNTAIGFVLAVITGQIVYWLYSIQVSVVQNLQITLIFTVISIARGYFVRRFFNYRIHALANRLSGDTE